MGRVRPGHEERELEELAAIERQVLELLLVDDLAHRGAHRVEERHRLADHDVRRHRARPQRHVQPQPLVHLHAHLDLGVGEARDRGRQRGIARLESRQLEGPVLPARRRPRDAAARVAHRDGHTRHR